MKTLLSVFVFLSLVSKNGFAVEPKNYTSEDLKLKEVLENSQKLVHKIQAKALFSGATYKVTSLNVEFHGRQDNGNEYCEVKYFPTLEGQNRYFVGTISAAETHTGSCRRVAAKFP